MDIIHFFKRSCFFAFRSLIRNFGFAEVTLARKTPNKFDFVELCRDSAQRKELSLCFHCSKVWLFAHLFVTLQHETVIHHSFTDCVECFHDIRMVRSLETARDENLHFVAFDRSDLVLLEHRSSGIRMPGASQPNRIRRQRRPIHPSPTEGHPGGGIAHRLHLHGHVHVSKRASALEPPRCFRLLDTRRVFCVPQVIIDLRF